MTCVAYYVYDLKSPLRNFPSQPSVVSCRGKRDAELEEQRKKAEFAAAVERARRMKIDPWPDGQVWTKDIDRIQ